MSITHFNGFDRGVIGKPLPADTTLNNMRKADLIKLLHLAESNHRALAETYKIAVDNSKCNTCPLHIDTRRADEIKADAIEELLKECCIGCAYLNGTKCEIKGGCPCSIGQSEIIRSANKVLEQLKEQK